MRTEERLVGIDAYKALLIVLVVLGHALQHVVTDFDGNLLVKAIYSHHMAAFFILSGFVTWRADFRFASLFTKLKRLLIPFVVWWLITRLLSFNADFVHAFCQLLRHPDAGGLWFLYVLAACHGLHFTLHAIADRLRIHPAVTLGAGLLGLSLAEVLTGYDEFGFHFIAWYFIFYQLGYWAHRMLAAKGLPFDRIPAWTGTVSAIVWCAMIPAWQRNTAIALPYLGELPNICAFGYRFAVVLCAFCFEWCLCARVRRLPAAVAFLGRNTLGIYAVHGLVLSYLSPCLPNMPQPARIGLLFAGALIITAALVQLIRRIPRVGTLLA